MRFHERMIGHHEAYPIAPVAQERNGVSMLRGHIFMPPDWMPVHLGAARMKPVGIPPSVPNAVQTLHSLPGASFAFSGVNELFSESTQQRQIPISNLNSIDFKVHSKSKTIAISQTLYCAAGVRVARIVWGLK